MCIQRSVCTTLTLETDFQWKIVTAQNVWRLINNHVAFGQCVQRQINTGFVCVSFLRFDVFVKRINFPAFSKIFRVFYYYFNILSEKCSFDSSCSRAFAQLQCVQTVFEWIELLRRNCAELWSLIVNWNWQFAFSKEIAFNYGVL